MMAAAGAHASDGSAQQPHELQQEGLSVLKSAHMTVPILIETVKRFCNADKHQQLDLMLQRYECQEIGREQVSNV